MNRDSELIGSYLADLLAQKGTFIKVKHNPMGYFFECNYGTKNLLVSGPHPTLLEALRHASDDQDEFSDGE